MEMKHLTLGSIFMYVVALYFVSKLIDLAFELFKAIIMKGI
jgi:hypothetical protein